MAEDDDTQTQTGSSMFAHLRVLKMREVEHFLERGDYVEGTDLAAALREQAGKPVPPEVLDYLCHYLEGNVTKPKGRKAISELKRQHREMVLPYLYQQRLDWLQRRQKRYGNLDGWPSIRRASWWKGPPNERAARMVAHRWHYGADSWHSVQNFISSQK